ncbi:MAG: lipopolysaccharide heptosyltransferase II [Candidatus Omnitrophica bacterium]|nr:lipopolysaccharide heptosyltransferase II [Candidatus Omnitrophota bacterium]
MNILVFNVNWLGDVIFSVPVFRALKEAYPDAKVCCLAVPRVKDIAECCPYIDELIIYDEQGGHRGLIGKIKLVWRLRKKYFDIAFLLHQSWTRSLLIYLAGVPVRVGYDFKKRGKLLTHKVELPEGMPHRSDHYLNVIESYGVKVKDRSCELAVLPEAKMAADRLLAKANIFPHDKVVMVNTGGNWDLKRWPIENFVELVKRLDQELQVKVVIPGAPKDVERAKEIARLSRVNPVILAGKTNLKELIALMGRADLVISSDSGPMHIASCVGTDVIGIFGPTRAEVTGPRGKGRSVIAQKDTECNRDACYKLDCPDNKCMKAVTVDDVMDAALNFLG